MGDAVHYLQFLFTNQVNALPCGDGTSGDDANITLLDFNGDDTLDLADGVATLLFLFGGGSSYPLGLSCVDVPGCADVPCAAPVRYSDVQPILQDKCTPCHSGPPFFSGNVCFVDVYADTQRNSFRCFQKRVYECILIRIQDGSMPSVFPRCSGDPAQDGDNPNCLNQQEQDLISAWVADGGLE